MDRDFKYAAGFSFGLPLGISFYTFHALSYLIDVYRGDVRAERSIRDMILYIAMFPQLVAGPLIRYKKIAGELHRPGSRSSGPRRASESSSSVSPRKS